MLGVRSWVIWENCYREMNKGSNLGLPNAGFFGLHDHIVLVLLGLPPGDPRKRFLPPRSTSIIKNTCVGFSSRNHSPGLGLRT
jgi:hypothetical protein